jgi:hypothetical protein
MNMLAEDNCYFDSRLIREYEEIFIKVDAWGVFKDSDIARKGLCESVGRTPQFVAEYEEILDVYKPGLAIAV